MPVTCKRTAYLTHIYAMMAGVVNVRTVCRIHYFETPSDDVHMYTPAWHARRDRVAARIAVCLRAPCSIPPDDPLKPSWNALLKNTIPKGPTQ